MANTEITRTSIRVLIGAFMVSIPACILLIHGNISTYMFSLFFNEEMNFVGILSPARMAFILPLIQLISNLIFNHFSTKVGIRQSVAIGSVLITAGFAVTYFSVTKYVCATLLTYIVMSGIGYGIVEPACIILLDSWFGSSANLATSIFLAAPGVGGVVYNCFITSYINPNNQSPTVFLHEKSYFSQVEITDRVPMAFLILGAISAMIQFIGFCLLKIRPPANRPVFKAKLGKKKTRSEKYYVIDQIRTRQDPESIVSLQLRNVESSNKKPSTSSSPSSSSSSSSSYQEPMRSTSASYHKPSMSVSSPYQRQQTSVTTPYQKPSKSVSFQNQKPPSSSNSASTQYQQPSSLASTPNHQKPPKSSRPRTLPPLPPHVTEKSTLVKNQQHIPSASAALSTSTVTPTSSVLSTFPNIEIEMETPPTPTDKTPYEVLQSRTFYVMWLSAFSMYAGAITAVTNYKMYGLRWDIDDKFLTTIGALSSLFTCICKSMCCYITDKWAIKNMLLFHTSLCTVFMGSCFFTSMVSGWVFMVWTVVIIGLFNNVHLIHSMALLKLYGKSRYGSNVFMLLGTVGVVSVVVMPTVMDILLDTWGWFALFSLNSALTFVAVLAIVFIMPKV